jgi:hypothetical protein
MGDMERERRKFKRLSVLDTAFAVFSPNYAKLGKIKDISRGGLSFEYIGEEGLEVEDDSSQIDILFSGGGLYMTEIPVKTTNDIRIQKSHTFTSRVQIRRCGVQFGELTLGQTALLDFLLGSYTTGPA